MESESFVSASYAEDRDATGEPRAAYAAALGVLETSDLAQLAQAIVARLADRGVSFGTEPFVVDPVPRLLAGAEWDRLAAGLAQRARALNRFLLDAYGPQEIVAAGVIPAATIAEAEGFEPD